MISIPQLLIIAVIIALLFGTKRLRSLGSDLGEAIKGFKKSVKDDESQKKAPSNGDNTASTDPEHSSTSLKKEHEINDEQSK